MGFRFRKSFGKGPFRVTVSKSGVGYSVGGKGFRVTKKAGGGMRTTASIPGTGISYVKDYSEKKPSATVSANNFVSTPSYSQAKPPLVARNKDNEYRYCRFCLKAINNDDDICPYCKKSQITGKSTKSGGSKAGWIWVLILILLLVSCNSSKSENHSNVKSRDVSEAIEIVEAAVSSVFSHYKISYEDSVISAIFWEDGLALLTDKAIAGNDLSLAKWNGQVGSIENISLNVANELKSSGITDISVLMILVDDRDTSKVLVAASGGISTLDRVALSEKPSNNSSGNKNTPTFSRSGSGSGSSQSSERKITYYLNTKTKKFHQSFCDDVDEIKSSNKSTYTGTRAEVIAKGYSPCGHCDP